MDQSIDLQRTKLTQIMDSLEQKLMTFEVLNVNNPAVNDFSCYIIEDVAVCITDED